MRFVAKVPDGGESRAAWFLWMLGGIAVSCVLISFVIFWDAVLNIAVNTGDIEISAVFRSDVPMGALEALIVAVVVAVVAHFARKRLLMPRETWFAVALPPLIMLVMAAWDAVNGSFLLLYLALVICAGISLGAIVDVMVWRRSQARPAAESA